MCCVACGAVLLKPHVVQVHIFQFGLKIIDNHAQFLRAPWKWVIWIVCYRRLNGSDMFDTVNNPLSHRHGTTTSHNEYIDSNLWTKLVIACLLGRELRPKIVVYARKVAVINFYNMQNLTTMKMLILLNKLTVTVWWFVKLNSKLSIPYWKTRYL